VDHASGASDEACDVDARRAFLGVDEDRRCPRQTAGGYGRLSNPQQELHSLTALHRCGADTAAVYRAGIRPKRDPQIQQDDVAPSVR